MSQFTLNPPIRNNFYTGARPVSRMNVRPNVYLPNGEIDLQTGLPTESARRTGRTQAIRRDIDRLDLEYAQLETALKTRAAEKGKRIPLKAAIGWIAAMVAVFAVILTFQQGNIAAREENIRKMNAKNTAKQEVINDISAQIDQASDPVQICYLAARDLDMVPAESAQAIYLTALSTRPGQEPITIRAGND